MKRSYATLRTDEPTFGYAFMAGDQLLALFHHIDLNKMGPVEYSKRTPEQNAYVLSLCNDESESSLFIQMDHRISTIVNNEFTLYPAEYNRDELAETRFTAPFKYFLKHHIIITEADQQKMSALDDWFRKARNSKGNSYLLMRSGFAFHTLLTTFLIYANHTQQQRFLSRLINVFGALDDNVTPLKTVRQNHQHNAQSMITEEEQAALLASLETRDEWVKIESFDELLIAADLRLADEMHYKDHQASQSPTSIEMALTRPPTHISTELFFLAQFADELVNDAERRKYSFPEERLLAAKIRLAINQQRVVPLSKIQFSKKLTPLLKIAERKFARNRHPKGLRIVRDILKILSLVGLIREEVRYLQTGQCRLFSHQPRSSETVDKLLSHASTRQLILA